jgi:hypothetical protein
MKRFIALLAAVIVGLSPAGQAQRLGPNGLLAVGQEQ